MYDLRQHANKPSKREGKHIHQAFDVGHKKTKKKNVPFSVAVNISLEGKYCGNKESRDPEGPSRKSRER